MGSAVAPQTLNRYAYVLNNPMRWLDPWGLRNVEGTPTPTPAGWMWVCGPVRAGGVVKTPTWSSHLPATQSIGPTSWVQSSCSLRAGLSSVSPRKPLGRCWHSHDCAGQPETPPWSFPTFLGLVEPALPLCLAD